MYVHLGNDCMVACVDVVAVINAVTLTDDEAAEDFIAQARARGMLRQLTTDEVLSYVVTEDTVFASSVRPATLQRRMDAPLPR